jgi:hypothetical protein
MVTVFASSDKDSNFFDGDTGSSFYIKKISNELFGDVKIKSSEYLYNLDGSSDYIYVDFENSGYAVYSRETMELLEYAPEGSLPYQNTGASKYYGGPTNYFNKEEGRFEDIVTGESIVISTADAHAYSRQMRKKFSIIEKIESERQTHDEVDYDKNILVDAEVNTPKLGALSLDTNKSAIMSRLSSPGIDDYPLISLGASQIPGATYIPNAEYFLDNPMHGDNSTGTCGAVAAQLLLSYNNYYNDRRIIDNAFLNGNDTTQKNQNPNFCENPMHMTRDTLGSRGLNENGNDDPNSYFAQIVSRIPSSAMPGRIKRQIRNIINDRNQNINFEVNSATGLIPINSSTIRNEIDQGRPLIVGMLPILGGWKHYAVGYGYSDYTYTTGSSASKTYSGYIAHFGHSGSVPNRLHVWVNSSWCNTAITLKINHTHNYNIDTGNIINDQSRELRCGECGHRTVDDLYYTQDLGSNVQINGLRYPVSVLNVPAKINGKNVTSIRNPFYNKTDLTSVTLPNSLISIGSNAFYGCTGLTSITVPDSVTSIGLGAFEGCVNLSSITVPYAGNLFGATSNAHFGYIFGASSYGNQNSYIPSSLKTVVVRKEYIREYTFYGCGGLTNITLPSGTASIGRSAFDGCGGLTNITIPSGVTNIGEYAFQNCKKLTGITIPANVTRIERGTFDGCEGLTNITIPGGITGIGDSAFKDCAALTSVTILSSVTSIGKNAFHGSGIWVNPSNQSNGVVYAGNWVIGYESASLESVSLRSNTVGLADYAFMNCISLTEISIPASVKKIGAGVFSGCGNLESINVNAANQNYASSQGILYNKATTQFVWIPQAVAGNIAIPNGVTDIWGFSNYKGITGITIPPSVTSIGENAFWDCFNLKSVTFEAGSLLETIGWSAFCNSAIEEIIIPAGVRKIEDGAFSICANLERVVFADGSQLTDIGNYMFYDCHSLNSVVLPDGLLKIGYEAFYNCYSLTEIEIPAGVWSIGNCAFYNCYSLENLAIGENVEVVEWNAFEGCDNLSIKWHYNTRLPSTWFNDHLTEIVFPDGLTGIGNYAFNGFSGLTAIEIPSTVTYIGWYAFCGTSLETIVLPQGLETIEDAAFADCPYLTDIEIPYSVTYIGDGRMSRGCWAFMNSDNLSVTWHYNPAVPMDIFGSYLKTIIFPEEVTGIDDYIFDGCSGLTDITFGGSIASIGNYAFRGCTGLTEIVIPDTVTSIGLGAFKDCTSLKSMTLPFVGASKTATGRNAVLTYIFGGSTNGYRHFVPQSLQIVTVTGGVISSSAFA